MADGLRRIARSIENKLHLVVFNQGLDKLGSYFARMSVPPGANGPLDIGSSGWMSYTAENARALGGERGTPLTDRLFLHGQVSVSTSSMFLYLTRSVRSMARPVGMRTLSSRKLL